MAEEAKKATETKAAASPKKATVKKKISKGQSIACEVCGLAVTVEEVGDMVVEEDSVLLCCGKPMKPKATKAKATAK